jgi:HSP20 family molecular chaperone IbpA
VILLPKKKAIKEAVSVEEEDDTTTVVTPDVGIDHDDHAYYIDVELPGVAKEHVDLSVGEQSLCVEAARDDVVYLGCFTLAHAVDESKAKAKFENGLLKVEIPLKAPIKGKRIKIE